MRQRLFMGTCVLLVVCAAPRASSPDLHVHLTFEPARTIPLAVRIAATREAAAIWREYGVTVDGDSDARWSACDPWSLPLKVAVDNARGAAEEDDGLAAVRFGIDESPEPTIALHYSRVVRIATSVQQFGVDASQWPARLRDDAIARTLGRVLAHELGHVLLRWPHHSIAGLMQSQHRASSLTGTDMALFHLTESEVGRLQAALEFRTLPDAAAGCGAVASAVSQP